MASWRLQDLPRRGDRRYEASSKAGGVVLQQQGSEFLGLFFQAFCVGKKRKKKKQTLAMKKAP